MRELPTYTIEIMRLFEAPADLFGEERYRAEFRAVSRVIGREELAAELGSADFEQCDLAALDALFIELKGEFESPQEAAQRAQMARIGELLDGLDLDKLDRLSALMERPRSRQGFRRVQ